MGSTSRRGSADPGSRPRSTPEQDRGPSIMSLKLLSRALSMPVTNEREFTARSVLACLAYHANDTGGSCFPSVTRIGTMCSMAKDAVNRGLVMLEGMGYITVTRQQNRCNRYQLHTAALPPSIGRCDPLVSLVWWAKVKNYRAKAVLLALVAASKDGFFDLSNTEMAAIAGASVMSIKRSLVEFKASGLLSETNIRTRGQIGLPAHQFNVDTWEFIDGLPAKDQPKSSTASVDKLCETCDHRKAGDCQKHLRTDPESATDPKILTKDQDQKILQSPAQKNAIPCKTEQKPKPSPAQSRENAGGVCIPGNPAEPLFSPPARDRSTGDRSSPATEPIKPVIGNDRTCSGIYATPGTVKREGFLLPSPRELIFYTADIDG